MIIAMMCYICTARGATSPKRHHQIRNYKCHVSIYISSFIPNDHIINSIITCASCAIP